MLAIANDGVGGARRALSHLSCAVSSAVPFYRVIALANCAHERLATWGCAVAWHCSTCLYGLWVMMSPPARTSCRCLSNAWVCLKNTWALMHAVATKSFFISMTHDPRRALWHVSAPEPTSEVRHGRKPRDACQCRSPPRWSDWVWSRGTCGSAGALLNCEVESRGLGHMAALEPS
jgi:hypothetical protein